MDEQNDEFDAYLCQFRPRPPYRRLDPTMVRRREYRVPLIAAAMLLISIAAYLALPVLRGPGGGNVPTPPVTRGASDPSSNVTLGRLTRAALAGPDELDAALLMASPLILPDVARPESTLHVLARDED
jgi:hypothetical protein